MMMAELETPSIESRVEAKLFGEPKAADEQIESTDQADEAVDQADEESEAVDPPKSAVEEVDVETDDGWKGKIPTSLKAELDKAADYTRKSQEVADRARIIDAKQRLDQENQAFYQSAHKEFERMREIDAVLDNYRSVDLTTVEESTLSRMSMAAANLREEKAKLKESIDSKRGEFKTKVVSAWDDMASKAHEAVTRSITDWDKNAGKVAEYAIAQGFPFELITGYDRTTRERVGPGVVDPTFAKTLYKAWRYDQLQSGKSTQLEKAQKGAPMLKLGAADTRTKDQVSITNFRKALNTAQSPARKAQLIGERVAARLEKLRG